MSKENVLALKTFFSYNVEDFIGYRTFEKDGCTFVNKVWCKVCFKYKAEIETAATAKGNAKKSAQAFVNGTNLVTKFQVRELMQAIFLYKNKSFIFTMESLVFLGNDCTTNNKLLEFALLIWCF